MFTPNPERSFTKKVTFNVPTDQGGFQQHTLAVEYRSLPKDQLAELQDQQDDDATYAQAVIGVEGVGDADGNAIKPKDAKAAMAQESSFVYEAVLTYYDAMLGGNLKGKTSKRRRAAG